jgi:hypothetical protein
MSVYVKEEKNRLVLGDGFANRQYIFWRCAGCGDWIHEDDILWVEHETGKATMNGKPYHPACAPSEKETKYQVSLSSLIIRFHNVEAESPEEAIEKARSVIIPGYYDAAEDPHNIWTAEEGEDPSGAAFSIPVRRSGES